MGIWKIVAQQWNVFNTTGLYTEKIVKTIEEGIKKGKKNKESRRGGRKRAGKEGRKGKKEAGVAILIS